MPSLELVSDPVKFEEYLRQRLSDRRVPEGCHEGLVRYLVNHIPTGSFLLAVLANDLREACNRADDGNRYRLFDIVAFLYNEAPMGSWGSPAHVKGWLETRPRAPRA